MKLARVRSAVFVALVALAASSACKRKEAPAPAGSASAGASKPAFPVADGIPMSAVEIGKVVNSGAAAAYSGPTGTIRGVVTIAGDPAPVLDEVVAKIPAECALAKDVHGRLFREGMLRSLADALVTVTGYKGYVPETRVAEQVEVNGCAWSSRTIALTFGQRLEVLNKDKRPYVPDLLGAGMKAQLVAVPGGEPIELYPNRVGRYLLVDSMRLFMSSDVLVLKYPTHDVTGLDGRYEISGIPVGKVTLTAFLPVIAQKTDREVEIVAGKTTDVDMQLSFDAKAYERLKKNPDAGAPRSAGAAPAPAASALPKTAPAAPASSALTPAPASSR